MADTPIPTVRIPELPGYDSYGDLSVADKMAIWMATYNKTVHVPLTVLRSFLLTGGGLSHPPVLNGNSFVVKVTALEAGGVIYSIPSLAGQDFILRRTVMGAMITVDEYEVLNAGGFKLTAAGDSLSLDERFEIQLVNSVPTTGGVSSTGSGVSISGTKTVSTNTTLGPSDIGKLIQIRAGSSSIALTLPPIETIPANSEIKIETNIGNTYQATILTSGGQFIYFQNTALSSLYIGVSELLTLYRGEDGYYMLPGAFGNFMLTGEVNYKYTLGLNEVLLNGSLLPRSNYPRLWEYAQTTGPSIVTDNDWVSVDTDGRQTYRGCFSYGDGTTTFRLPNLLDMFIRGVQSLSASDSQRPYNKPGGYQVDMFKSHDHALQYYRNDSGGGSQGNTYYLGSDNGGLILTADQYKTATRGGTETRPKNIGLLPTMKC